MFRILSIFLWLLLLTATPIAAQNNPIFTATNNNKELLYLPEMPSNLPAEPSPAKDEPCDIIELKKGGEILAHIVAIEKTQIKYQKCGKIKKIDRIISKLHVARIRYANGTVVEIQKEEEEKEAKQKAAIEERRNATKDIDVFGILSLVCGFVGIFFAGIIFGLAAFILGVASAARAKRSKAENKSSYILGILGIILSLVVLIGTLINISKLLNQ